MGKAVGRAEVMGVGHESFEPVVWNGQTGVEVVDLCLV